MLRHGLIVVVLTNLAGVANAVFHVVMGWNLSRAEYGIMASMLGVILLVGTPLTAVQNTLAHYSRHLVVEGRAGDIRALLKRWLRPMLFLSLPMTALAVLLRGPIAAFFHLNNPWLIVATALAVQCFILVPLFAGILQGLQRFVWMCMAASGWGYIRLALAALAVALGVRTAMAGVVAHGVALVVSLALGAIGLRLALGGQAEKGGPVERSDRYFLLSLLTLLAYSVMMNADVILVKHFFPDEARYGAYARASTIARTMVFLAQPVALAMFPKVVSRGASSAHHQRVLWMALAFSGAIILGAAALFAVWPGLPLRVLFNVTTPDEGLARLVRAVSLAMAPLGLAYIVLNYEMAQRRFACLAPIAAGAVAYVIGMCLFHARIDQAAYVLAAASLLALAGLLVVFRRGGRAAAPSGSEEGAS